jgi:hypothetical protein
LKQVLCLFNLYFCKYYSPLFFFIFSFRWLLAISGSSWFLRTSVFCAFCVYHIA